VNDKKGLRNLYTYKPAEKKDVAKAIEDALNAEPSRYDSHPAPAARFAFVRALAVPPPSLADDDQKPAWSLFSDRARIEEAMTDEIRAKMHLDHGVHIPKPEEEEAEEEAAQEAGVSAA
jgi:hypothetical protein